MLQTAQAEPGWEFFDKVGNRKRTVWFGFVWNILENSWSERSTSDHELSSNVKKYNSTTRHLKYSYISILMITYITLILFLWDSNNPCFVDHLWPLITYISLIPFKWYEHPEKVEQHYFSWIFFVKTKWNILQKEKKNPKDVNIPW